MRKQPVMSDAKTETEALLNELVPLAEALLTKYGEFYPFGAVMDFGGGIIRRESYPGGEHPRSQDVIDLLRKGMRIDAESGDIKAAAIAYDVRLADGNPAGMSDAIAVALDHRDDYSVIVAVPYRLQGGQIEIGELFAEPGSNQIFGA